MTSALMVQKHDDVRSLFSARRDELARAAAKHLDPDKLLRLALSACSRNPKLYDCTKASLLAAVMDCAKLGLEPTGRIGGAHLVPYGREATLVTDYRGEIQLARRSGQLSTIAAHVVREGDHFELELGDNERLVHRPDLRASDDRQVEFVYAVAHLRDGGIQRAVLTVREVERYRAKSRAKNGPWVTDWEAMAKKTAIRRVCNLLPMSVEWREFTAREESIDEGRVLDVVGADVPAAPPASAGDELAAELEGEAETPWEHASEREPGEEG